MNYQSKGFQLSFVIHALVFMLIISISRSIVSVSKPILIDFNIEDSIGAPRKGIKEAPKPKPEIRSQKSEVREQKPEIEKPEQKISPQIPDTNLTPASISEAQAPVPAPTTTEAKKSGEEGVHKAKDANTVHNDSNNLSDKKRIPHYLKENFSYIRDIIQKNIAYPHIARKKGLEGKVVVSFIVCADGKAQDITITESSGFEILDRSAVEAVRKASPFPKPPAKAALIIPVAYKLN